MNWMLYLEIASQVVAGASVMVLALSKVAPKLGKVGAFLQKLLPLLNKIALNPGR